MGHEANYGEDDETGEHGRAWIYWTHDQGVSEKKNKIFEKIVTIYKKEKKWYYSFFTYNIITIEFIENCN